MDKIAAYALSVIGAALVLGIIKGIGGNGFLLQLMGGLFLTIVIVQPLAEFEFSSLADYVDGFSLEGQQIAAAGSEMGDEACKSVIKQELEAYILDKAKNLGTELEVELTLDENDLPAQVQLHGEISSGSRMSITLWSIPS